MAGNAEWGGCHWSATIIWKMQQLVLSPANYQRLYEVEVDGKLRFRLADGREFKSTSAAGMAITGKSCNGWAFWSVQKEEAPVANAQATNTPPETPGAPATE